MNKKLLTTLILCIFTFEPMCWADGQVRYSNHQNIKEKNVDVNDNLVEFIDNFYYYYDTYRYINFYVAKYNNKYALYANNNIILEPIYDNFDILKKNIVSSGRGSGHDYSVNYLKVKKDNKWAIYSVAKNKFITDFSYDSIEPIENTLDLLVKLKRNDKFALLKINEFYPTEINRSDFVYDDISQIINSNSPSILKVKKQNKWGVYLIDNDHYKFHGGSREISKIEYDDIKCENDYQKAFNDYYIENIKGKKNNSWQVLYKTKTVSKNWLDKAIGNGWN